MRSRTEVSGRVVLVTGATGGLGAELARALHARGALLVLCARNAEAVDALAKRLGGPRASIGVAADVRDLAGVEAAARAAVKHFGRIDVVVAGAGTDTAVLAVDASEEQFVTDVDVNLTGVWRTARATAPSLERSGGYFLTVSSMAAFVHSPTQASYAASKAGAWALTNSLRLELRPRGIAVGCVHPTFFRTTMLQGIQANPITAALWGGNRRGMWRAVDRETVVRAVVDAIERRRRTVTVPRAGALVAAAPSCAQAIAERSSFGVRRMRRVLASERPGPPAA